MDSQNTFGRDVRRKILGPVGDHMSTGNCDIDRELWCLQESVMFTGTLCYLQGVLMFTGLQGIVICRDQ
jgi:hypothetical protein